jgi:hypothetical protein
LIQEFHYARNGAAETPEADTQKCHGKGAIP